jgi:hypothetical protein
MDFIQETFMNILELTEFKNIPEYRHSCLPLHELSKNKSIAPTRTIHE